MTVAAELLVRVGADVSNAERTLGGFGNRLSGIASGMQHTGAMMTAGITVPAAAMGIAMVNAASDLEESMNKVNVVFGDSAQQIQSWAETSAEAFGLSQQQALEAVGTFGNLFDAMGIGEQETATMSQGLIELAADLASFNNIPVDVALEKLRAGLVGEMEPLRTLGVNLNAASTKAYALEHGLAASTDELTPAVLAQARYALILEQTTNAQGDFARTSDGLANSMRITKAQLADAAATLGRQLLPVVTQVVRGVSRLIDWFTNLPEPVQRVIMIVGGLVAAMGPLLMIIGSVISAVTTIGGAFAGLGGIIGAAAAAIGAALGPVLIIIGVLAAAVLAFKLAWDSNFLGIRDTIQAVFGEIRNIVSNVMAFFRGEISFDDLVERTRASWQNIVDTVRGFLENIVQAISEAVARFIAPLVGGMDNAKRIMAEAWENIKQAVGAAWEFIKGIISGAIEFIRGVIATAMQILSGDWGSAWETIKTAVVNVWESITGGIQNALDVIGPAISTAWETIKSTIERIVGGIYDFVVNKLGELVRKAIEFFGRIIDALTGGGGGGGNEPALTLDIGAMIASLREARAEWQAFREFIDASTDAILATLTAWLTASRTLIAQTWTTILTNTQTTWQTIYAFLQTTWTTILATMTTWLATTLQTLRTHLEAVYLAITTSWTTIKNWLYLTWEQIKAEYIRQLTEMLAQTRQMNQWMLQDFERVWPQILNAVVSNASAMRDQAVAIMNDMAAQVGGILNGMVSAAGAAGAALGSAFADGIMSQLGAVQAAAAALAAAAGAYLPHSDAKKGPLSHLTDSGRQFSRTFAKGIRLGAPQTVQAVDDMVSKLRPIRPYELAKDMNDLLAADKLNTALAAAKLDKLRPTRPYELGAQPYATRPWEPAKPPMPYMPPKPPSSEIPGGIADIASSERPCINITINNPTGQPSEESIMRVLKKLAAVGALNPV